MTQRNDRNSRAALPLCLSACLLIGCQAQDEADSGSRAAAGHTSGIDLDKAYIIPPDTVRDMGYRIDWQADVQPIGDSGIRLVRPQDDAVFVLDGQNYLSRLRREDGRRLWQIPVAEPLREVLGVTYVPALERIYLTNVGSLLVLDGESGSPVARQPLEKAANTAPVLYGEYLIYGTRDGQAVWHSHLVEFQWRGYQVAESILLKPVLEEDHLVVVGNDDASRSSRIMVLDPRSATQRWSKPLLDEVMAQPDVADGVVYVASTDQYLYAFDILSGRTHWSRLTTSPLVDRPVVVGDHLYQQVPGEGLTCFDALPPDAPDGLVIWRCPQATGTVIATHRERLLVWDADSKELAVVSAGRGALIELTSLPQVTDLWAPGDGSGHLIAYAEDGRVLRLAAR